MQRKIIRPRIPRVFNLQQEKLAYYSGSGDFSRPTSPESASILNTVRICGEESPNNVLPPWLDAIQERALRLINDPTPTASIEEVFSHFPYSTACGLMS